MVRGRSLCEAMENRVLFAGADLAVSVMELNAPASLVPSDVVTLKARVTNVGALRTQGTVNLRLAASNDTTFEWWADHLIVQDTIKSLDLAPGASKDFRISGTVPAGVVPGTCHLLLRCDPVQLTNADGNPDNDMTDCGTRNVSWRFGNVDGRHNVRLVLVDGDTSVTFSLQGPGTGEVQGGEQSLTSASVVLTGTTRRTDAKIATSKGHTCSIVGIAVANSAAGTGSIGSIDAPTTNVGSSITVPGLASQILVHDFGPGSVTVSVDADGLPAQGHALVFHARHLQYGNINTGLEPLQTMAVASAMTTSITAPAIRSMRVSGIASGEGDYSGDITVTGGSGITQALGDLWIQGTLAGKLNVTGNVGTIAAAKWTNSQVQCSGTVRSIAVRGDMSPDIHARSLASTRVGGSLSGNWTCKAGDVHVAGDLAAFSFDTGATGGAVGPQLAHLKVGGWATWCYFTGANRLGDLDFGGIRGLQVKLGYNGDGLPTSATDFDPNHTATVRSLTVHGMHDSTGKPSPSLLSLQVTAWSLDKVSLAPAVAGSTYLNMVAHSIGQIIYRGLDGKTHAARNLSGPSTFVEDENVLIATM